MAADIPALLDEMDEIEEFEDDEEEERWLLAAAMVGANHGTNHCCAEPCQTAPYTGSTLANELLETHQ
jgi:hypothetical protein